MGVHNLWELLSPVGRRVSVETLAGKKVAIDASIWIVQFMKAMRDEKGEMVRNAHLIGFFRRICKLLFLRTKPVFVFDGGTPALKRRTVIARRRQRENAQMKIRKTAEKLLMNQLKTMKLNQLAEDLKNQREGSDIKGKKVLSDQSEVVKHNLELNDMIMESYNQGKIDEMLAFSLAAEEGQSFTRNASTSTAGIPLEKEEEDDDDDDDDEEMILPAMPGKVDPAVLAALPPSMQLDLLVQMRERLMAENRQKYQKVKKAPAKFSELQIQSYLKTVAFRREIGEVQKSAAGRGVGGVQTSRIASESNREFIFSSSFTGDKQALTAAGAESSGNPQHQTRSDSLGTVASSVKNSTAAAPARDEPGGGLENDVETYLDDRGNLRVSRVRAMGIRMTRDLQRNLDMIKEIELESHNENIATHNVSVRDDSGAPMSLFRKDQFPGTSVGANDDRDSIINSRDQQSIPKYEASIEISFEDNGEKKCSEDDDYIFAGLVAGNPLIIPPIGNTSFRKQSSGSASESDWEDGFVEDKVSSRTNYVKAEIKPYFVEGNSSDESKRELEEGIRDVAKSDSPSSVEYTEAITRGCQEEETDMQEAIRRSIEDLKKKNFVDVSSENHNRKYCAEIAHKNPDSFLKIKELLCETLRGTGKQDGVIETSIPTIVRDSGTQLVSSTTCNNENMKSPAGKPCETYSAVHLVNLDEETQEMNLVPEKIIDAFNEGGETSTTDKKFQVNFNKGDEPSTVDNNAHVNDSFLSDLVLNDDPDANLFNASKGGSESEHKTAEFAVPLGESSANQASIIVDVKQKLADIRDNNNSIMETESSRVEVTESTLEEEILVLGQEFTNLEDEQRKNERNAESVSSEMFAECQELLQMFGLPYIIAPMEAEAQCAYMELANLVDGVVTDDSDVFLFGARSVYKNIFDDRKYVETYFMKDIENELGLSRDKLIRMALLLGSDYTEGISGIGIVNAIEVVNAFPEEDGLHKFRQWIESPDPNILGKFQVQKGSTSRKRGSVANEEKASRSDQNLEKVSTSEPNQVHNDDQSMELINEQRQIFMDKHRNVSKNWHIPSSFPSEAVISAYSSPQVDKSTEPFAWGKPDLVILRKLCWGKFGWNIQKADELLLPVLKEYNKHETQLRLEAFYTFNEKFAKVRSKRIKKAVKGIIGNQSSDVQDGSVQPLSKTRKRKTVGPIESWVNGSEKRLCHADNDVARKERNSTSSHKQSGEGTVSANLTPSIEEKMQSKRAVARGHVRDGSSGNSRNRGRGRKKQGQGGRKGGRVFYHAKSSSSDGYSSNNEHELHDEKLQEPCKLRRSSRSRNPVYYLLNDLECDDAEDMGDECANKQAIDQEQSPRQGLSEDPPIGPTDKNQPNFADPLPDIGIGEIQYVIGSGVCMDKDEMCEPSVKHTEDNAECSNDYLTIGGGFCMDEDETEQHPEEQANNLASATTAEVTADKTVHENLAESGCCIHEETLNGLQVGRQTEEASAVQIMNFLNDNSNVAVPSEENTKDHFIRALSAMPLLRRKRRKS